MVKNIYSNCWGKKVEEKNIAYHDAIGVSHFHGGMYRIQSADI